MKRIICFFKGHIRGKTWFSRPYPRGLCRWQVECKRCGYAIEYRSPRARLVGEEIRLGFDGK